MEAAGLDRSDDGPGELAGLGSCFRLYHKMGALEMKVPSLELRLSRW